MDCEFRNCKEPAFTAGNIIVWSEDGDYDDVALCKKHVLMFVAKKMREYVKSKEYPHYLKSIIPPDEQIARLQQMIDIIKRSK
jgi:hypothetical protein